MSEFKVCGTALSDKAVSDAHEKYQRVLAARKEAEGKAATLDLKIKTARTRAISEASERALSGDSPRPDDTESRAAQAELSEVRRDVEALHIAEVKALRELHDVLYERADAIATAARKKAGEHRKAAAAAISSATDDAREMDRLLHEAEWLRRLAATRGLRTPWPFHGDGPSPAAEHVRFAAAGLPPDGFPENWRPPQRLAT